MTDRYLFLDFDGVINGLNPASVEKAWGRRAFTVMQGFSITYAPELVAAVEAMANEGVNVVWLTTWCQHTREFPSIGFAKHPYIGEEEHAAGSSPWWKYVALKIFLRDIPDDALIGWCDDDLAEYADYEPLIQAFIDRPHVLGISPSTWTGLNRDHVAALRTHFGIEATND